MRKVSELPDVLTAQEAADFLQISKLSGSMRVVLVLALKLLNLIGFR